jgi:phosphoglycerol transferase MdoB-like AlkP superfamily enzyme
MFFIILLLMSLARLAFTLYFGDWAQLTDNQELVRKAFFLGLRYDLIPLAYVTALPFVILNISYFIPGKTNIRVTQRSLIFMMWLSYVILIWTYILDYAFFSFFQDHINILFYGLIEDDTTAVLTSIWKNYNIPGWGLLVLLVHYFLFKMIKICFSFYDFDYKPHPFSWKMPVVFTIGLIVLAFFGRGNFTRLPLSIEDAHISTNDFINKISLNGVISLNRAYKIRKVFGKDNFDYLKKLGFKDWTEAFEVYFGNPPRNRESILESLKYKIPLNTQVASRPPHVVLIVSESFGSYWNSKHSPSFNLLGDLDQHFKQGILFKNFLPAENGTIGSIVSVATSQVIRPGARFLSESEFMRTPLASSGQIPYKKSGYETHFVYGGRLGWRDLGKFLSSQGYDYLWGADEIKESMPELNNIEEQDLGNEWGIFDEYLYTFIEEQLRTATTPQFFLVLTTSNHPPFEYPSSYNTRPLNFDESILESLSTDEDMARKRFLGLQYANQKTADFIDKIRKSGISDKVVISLTGDHSYWIAKGLSGDQEFLKYAVPFFISLPPRLKPTTFNAENFGSHEDIFPTLYDVTLSEVEYVKLGESLFSEAGISQNSTGLIASQAGAFHNNNYWSWASEGKLAHTTENEQIKIIKRKAEALIALTDAFLKSTKSAQSSVSKNDQQ